MSDSHTDSGHKSEIFVVDRIEGNIAILVSDRGEEALIAVGATPFGLIEGLVVRVPFADGAPDWQHCKSDPEETRKRLDEARQRMQRLRKSDPGGDIKL